MLVDLKDSKASFYPSAFSGLTFKDLKGNTIYPDSNNLIGKVFVKSNDCFTQTFGIWQNTKWPDYKVGSTFDSYFIPEETGLYLIQSTGDSDLSVTVYDFQGNRLAFDDDSGDSTNFSVYCFLEARKIYRFSYYLRNTGTDSETGWYETVYRITNIVCDDIIFRVDGYEASVSGCTGEPATLTIPDMIYGVPVTSIRDRAFDYYTSLVSVTIPDSITNIGSSAFYGCTSLTSMVIPGSVLKIGDNAFSGCTSLVSVAIRQGTKSIESEAFYGCTSLVSVTIPGSVTYLGSRIFSGCTSLNGFSGTYQGIVDGIMLVSGTTLVACAAGPNVKSVSIPVSISNIDHDAFYGCTSLASVSIPGSVTTISYSMFSGFTSLESVYIGYGTESIGSEAFYGCTSLSSIHIPGSVTYIGDYAFYGCTSLSSVSMPSVASIGDYAFYGCTSLSYLSIPSVSSIGDFAFYGYISLSSVDIPESTTYIGKGSFVGCPSLTSINVAQGNQNYSSIDGVLFDKNKNHLMAYPAGKQNDKYSIPDSVASIGDGAFGFCTSLSSVHIPNSVASIGNAAFYSCTSLSSVTIPPSVTSIGDGAFFGCTSLSSVSIPNSVTSIGGGAFSGCWLLNRFSGSYRGIIDGIMLVSDSSLVSCAAGPKITSVSIPNSVDSISYRAFALCSSLISVEIPESVTSIGNEAFIYCESLASISIPDSVNSIGRSAFYPLVFQETNGDELEQTPNRLSGHKFTGSGDGVLSMIETATPAAKVGDRMSAGGLVYEILSLSPASASLVGYKNLPSSVTVPDYVDFLGTSYHVTSVGTKAFYGCATLTFVDLGSIATVGTKSFAYCANIKSLTIPETVKEFRPYAFFGCSSLKTLVIPGDDVAIGTSAFSACKSMRSISFNGTGATIGTNAFYKNNGVSSIDLSTVASVGFKAFPYCNGLTSLTVPGHISAVGEYAFFNCANLKHITLEEGVRKVGKSAFSGCKALESAEFPSTLEYVGANAFFGVKFYDGPSKIGATAANLAGKTFVGSGGKLILSLLSDGDAFEAGGLRFEVASVSLCEVSLIGYSKAPVSLNVPSEVVCKDTSLRVVSIGAKAFYGCETLKSMDLGSVRDVGMKAFANCVSLRSVDLGDSLTEIGQYAFFNCPSVEVLDSPQSLQTVGKSAFGGLKFMDGGNVLPHDAQSLSGKRFLGAEGILSLGFDGNFALGGLTYSASVQSATVTGCLSPIVTLTVPSEISYGGKTYAVTAVGDKAFYGCATLISVDLGSVSSVGLKAFANCGSLREIDFGSSLKTIGAYAFFGCPKIEHLDVPPSLQSVGAGAFGGLYFHDASGKIAGASADNLRGHEFSGSGGKLYLIG